MYSSSPWLGNTESVKILLNNNANIRAKDNYSKTALHWATGTGKEEVVKILLNNKGADINAKDSNGRTALHRAAIGYTEVVKILLNNNANIRAKDNYSRTALHLAAWAGHIEVVKILLSKGADINIRNKKGLTASDTAEKEKHINIVRIILFRKFVSEHFPNNDAALFNNPSSDFTTGKNKSKPIHVATIHRNKPVIEFLIEKGADINAKDSNGGTALHWAAWARHIEVVKILLSKGADINIKNKKGFTALGLAKLNSSEGVIKSIYEHQIRSVPYYFSEFAKSFFTSEIGELCVNPSLACTTGIYRKQPIHVAARHGNKQVLNFLIGKGADINAKDSDGKTALYWAAWAGHIEVVKILLSKGADINIRNKKGLTASDTAEKEKHINIVRIILFRKFVSEHFPNNDAALFNNPSSDFTTGKNKSKPIHVATIHRNKPVIEFLIEKGADINAKDSNGGTALHWAAWARHIEVVKILLSKGADINIKNKKGFTALGLAKLNSSEGVIKSIYEHQIRSVPYYFSEFAKSFFTSEIGELCVNPSLACTTGIYRKQPIHVAARHGNKQVLNFLIGKGADINAKDSDGKTALYWAAWAGHIEVVKILLSKGADINIRNKKGFTASDTAEKEKHINIVRIILFRKFVSEHFPNNDAALFNNPSSDFTTGKNKSKPIHVATIHRNKPVIEFLIEKGAKINAKDSNGGTALHWAAWLGYKEVANLLLNNNANIRAKDNYSRTALHWAVREGKEKIVKILLSNKVVDINAKDSDGETALHWAAWLGNTEVVKILLSKGADINIKNKEGVTALGIAKSNSSEGVIESIYEHQIRSVPNYFSEFAKIFFSSEIGELCVNPSLACTTGIYRKQPIHVAARHGNKQVLNFLIGKGADINAKDSDGCTALHLTARKGKEEIVKILLSKGADINIRNKKGFTASDTAEKEKHINIVRIILFRKFVSEHFPNNAPALFNNPSSDFTTGKNKSKPIHVATIHRNKPVIEFLIEKGAKINAKDSNGGTALHWAAWLGYKEVANLLLNNNANIRAKDNYSRTALHWAVREGKEKIVQILLSNKVVDINAKDRDGETALHWAAWARHIEVVKILLSKGADINIKNKKGFTALGIAKNNSSEGIIESIYEHQIRSVPNYFSEFAKIFFSSDIGELCVNPSLACTTGIYRRQPIHVAARHGNKQVLNFLIRKGADINAKDNYSRTALHWAVRGGKEEIVKILLSKGADINIRNKKGLTASDTAEKEKHINIVRIILFRKFVSEHFPNNDAALFNNPSSDFTTGKNKSKPIHVATINRNKPVIEFLIEKGAKINAKDSDGETALHWAAREGKEEIVKILLSKGADINIKNQVGLTASDTAEKEKHINIVRIILFRKFVSEHFPNNDAALFNNPSSDFTTGKNKSKPIHVATITRNKPVIEFLIEKGAKINAKDSDGETALHWAAREGKEEIVKILLNKGADINIRNKKGLTALGIAKSNSSEGVIKSIYEHQISSVPNYFSEFAKIFFSSDIGELCVNPSLACTTGIYRKQPIHVAALNGNKQVLNFLIRKGADINAKDSDGCTALYWAAWAGHIEVVKILLSKGADINIRNKKGLTASDTAEKEKHINIVRIILFRKFVSKHFPNNDAALFNNPSSDFTTGKNESKPIHVATTNRNKPVIEFLIEKGAKINAKDSNGGTALHWAAWLGYKEVAKLLLNNNANIRAKDNYSRTALHWAVRGGKEEIVKILLRKGADINAKDSDGETALHWAARGGKEEIVKILLRKGADINAKDSDGETALHWAAREGKEEIVKILLSKGADINIRNKKGLTASDTAEKEKHINIVRIILFRKFVSEHFPNNDAALFNNPSSDFTTGKNKSKPIHVATTNRNKPVIEFLIEKGADINAKDNYSRTALHWAVRGGKEEIVKILLRKGADINAKDSDGETALHWAARGGKEEIVKILLSKGADINIRNKKGLTASDTAILSLKGQ